MNQYLKRFYISILNFQTNNLKAVIPRSFKKPFLNLDDNFIRIRVKTRMRIKPEKITEEEFLINSIEKAIEDTNAKILLIMWQLYIFAQWYWKGQRCLPLMKKTEKHLNGNTIYLFLHLQHTHQKGTHPQPIYKKWFIR